MNFIEAHKNRIDNEIQEIRDRRNIFLAAELSTPAIFIGLFYNQSHPIYGFFLAGFAVAALEYVRDKTQKELESKFAELRDLEEKLYKKKPIKLTKKKIKEESTIDKLKNFYKKYIHD